MVSNILCVEVKQFRVVWIDEQFSYVVVTNDVASGRPSSTCIHTVNVSIHLTHDDNFKKYVSFSLWWL